MSDAMRIYNPRQRAAVEAFARGFETVCQEQFDVPREHMEAVLGAFRYMFFDWGGPSLLKAIEAQELEISLNGGMEMGIMEGELDDLIAKLVRFYQAKHGESPDVFAEEWLTEILPSVLARREKDDETS